MLTNLSNRSLWRWCVMICLVTLMQVACREAPTPESEAKTRASASAEQGDEAPLVKGENSSKAAESETGDPKVEALIADLSAKWAKVKSAKAEITMTARDTTGGLNLTSGGYGKYVCKKIEGQLFIRREMVNGLVPRPGQPLMQRESTIITGPDFSYFYGEEGGRPFAQKRRTDLDEIVRLGGRTLLNQLKRQYTLKRLPDSEVEGQPVHVIAGVPPSGRGRATFLFSADSGAMVQMKMETLTGEKSQTVLYSNIELNPDVEDALFEFKPPPGVDVIDFTKQTGSK